MKDETSNSWFIQVNKILQKYNLPSALEMLETPKKKNNTEEREPKSNNHLLEQQTYWRSKWKNITQIPSHRQNYTRKTTSSMDSCKT